MTLKIPLLSRRKTKLYNFHWASLVVPDNVAATATTGCSNNGDGGSARSSSANGCASDGAVREYTLEHAHRRHSTPAADTAAGAGAGAGAEGSSVGVGHSESGGGGEDGGPMNEQAQSDSGRAVGSKRPRVRRRRGRSLGSSLGFAKPGKVSSQRARHTNATTSSAVAVGGGAGGAADVANMSNSAGSGGSGGGSAKLRRWTVTGVGSGVIRRAAGHARGRDRKSGRGAVYVTLELVRLET